MEEKFLIKKSTLTALADAIRDTLNTTNTYTPEEMAEAIGSNTIVDGSSLINYNIEFSFSSSLVTIVVVVPTGINSFKLQFAA